MSLREALSFGSKLLKKAGISTYQLDSEVLLAFILNIERSALFAHGERTVTSKEAAAYKTIIKRRCARKPVAYLTKQKEFFGRNFVISPAVLIPRPDTEILVQCVLDYVSAYPECKAILDIGTGSGCIAVSIASAIPNVIITATDISERSLKIAAKNIRYHGLSNRIRLKKTNLYPPGIAKFDCIVSNPPYLSLNEYKGALKKYPELRYEPRRALIAPQEGLAVISRILRTYRQHLTPNGVLFLEIGSGQGKQIRRIAKKTCPEARISFHRDLAGKTRVAMIEFF